MSMSDAVATTVAALAAEDRDRAATALAELLAAELDGAAAWRARADKIARELRAEEPDSFLLEEVDALRAKLSERACLDRIGGQLRALLVELQATPKSRGSAKPAPSGGGKLGALRAV